MLIEFSVANYRSFRQEMTLSMEAEPRLSERDKSVDERNVVKTPRGDLLRVAGIYGANASGKSNLIRALAVARAHILNSAREGQAGDTLPFEPFRLDRAAEGEPSAFQLVFLLDGHEYRYGFSATPTEVTTEWLHVHDAPGAEAQLLFSRDGASYQTGGGWARDPGLEEKTRKEALHLSVAASFNQPTALKLFEWFRRLRVSNGLSDGAMLGETTRLLDVASHRDAILELVRTLDFGVVDLRIEPNTSKLSRDGVVALEVREVLRRLRPTRLVSLRVNPIDGSSVPFELDDESAGTAKAIAMAGPVVDTLMNGGVLAVDEFDARLHTLLALKLVQLFQDPVTNPRAAQLIFVSHDTNLLSRSLLRRDQLWFTEKSRLTEATDLYSLAEIRFPDGGRVRNDARYETDYLQGRYGAIPFFGNLEALVGLALNGARDDDGRP